MNQAFLRLAGRRTTILLPVLILAGGLGLAACSSRAEEKAPLELADSAATQAPEPSTLSAADAPGNRADERAKGRDVTLRLTGSLIADEDAAVAANTDGIVVEIPVERGTLLDPGDLIARLDARDKENALAEGTAAAEELRAQLGLKSADAPFNVEQRPEVERAKAALELAESTHRRNVSLLTSAAIPQQDVDRSANEQVAARKSYELAIAEGERLHKSYESALIRLRSLNKAVEDTTIRAPFRGVIAEKHVSRGERLAPGGAVATLVRIDPLRLDLTVSERDIAKVDAGQSVSFSVPAYSGETFRATVVRLSPVLDAATRSLTIECLVANPDLRLRPGMFATATIVASQAPGAAESANESLIPTSLARQ